MGWYGGLGGRQMLQTVPIGGVQQPACPTVDAATMLMAATGRPPMALAIPTTWTDGVYLAVLSSAQGFQNYVPFVVRDDARQASLPISSRSTPTRRTTTGVARVCTPSTPAVVYARTRWASTGPIRPTARAITSLGGVYGAVAGAVRVRRHVQQPTSTPRSIPADLRSVKGVVIPGHSEYWSKGMYDARLKAPAMPE